MPIVKREPKVIAASIGSTRRNTRGEWGFAIAARHQRQSTTMLNDVAAAVTQRIITTGMAASNENKMSDGGRGRASLVS